MDHRNSRAAVAKSRVGLIAAQFALVVKEYIDKSSHAAMDGRSGRCRRDGAARSTIGSLKRGRRQSNRFERKKVGYWPDQSMIMFTFTFSSSSSDMSSKAEHAMAVTLNRFLQVTVGHDSISESSGR